ncbi:MAG: hypothetical protein J4F40_15815 [Alphaproteobacteria bacterium]|nr:hypothetical protein [Alphaproteobacteria bacterium]
MPDDFVLSSLSNFDRNQPTVPVSDIAVIERMLAISEHRIDLDPGTRVKDRIDDRTCAFELLDLLAVLTARTSYQLGR